MAVQKPGPGTWIFRTSGDGPAAERTVFVARLHSDPVVLVLDARLSCVVSRGSAPMLDGSAVVHRLSGNLGGDVRARRLGAYAATISGAAR
jgi:autotransporter translocation and assembly factor TamB